MQESEIYLRLRRIFSDVFDEDLEVKPETSAQDVSGWESFSHINLILAIESAFAVRFTSSEIERMHNVCDMVALIQQRLDEKP